jgi:hypothetical protein
MLRLIFAELVFDPRQPFVELPDRPGVQRRKRADDAGLALAITRSGPDTMKSGEPTTGNSRRLASEAGSVISDPPGAFGTSIFTLSI